MVAAMLRPVLEYAKQHWSKRGFGHSHDLRLRSKDLHAAGRTAITVGRDKVLAWYL